MLTRGDVVKVALQGMGAEWDWAVPQSWFDAYMAEHGRPPDAVWYYGHRCRVFGRPVAFAALLRLYRWRMAAKK